MSGNLSNDPAVRTAILERLALPEWRQSLEASRPTARVPLYSGKRQIGRIEVETDRITDLLFLELLAHFTRFITVKWDGEQFAFEKAHRAMTACACGLSLRLTLPVIARGPARTKDGTLDWHPVVLAAIKKTTRGVGICEWCGNPFRASRNNKKCSPACEQAQTGLYENRRRDDLKEYKADGRADQHEQKLTDDWLRDLPDADRQRLLTSYRQACAAEGAEHERLLSAVFGDPASDKDTLARLHTFKDERASADKS